MHDVIYKKTACDKIQKHDSFLASGKNYLGWSILDKLLKKVNGKY